MASLLDGFVQSVHHHPQRTALEWGDRRWTYRQLSAQAARLANGLCFAPRSRQPWVGLLAAESATAYQGVLAIWAARRGMVPLNPHDPPAWLSARIAQAKLDTLIVGAEGLDRLPPLLSDAGGPLTIVAPEVDDLSGLAARFERHRFVGADAIADRPDALPVPPEDDEAPACLLYTSGTTGPPKAVPLKAGQVRAYLDQIDRRLDLNYQDRCSHTFPLTFDLSLHDLLTTWAAGATLVPWPTAQRADPARFIAEQRLTRWFSVPSVAMTMARLGGLRPGQFPRLRQTYFCGEALPADTARAWQEAAPNSQIVNLYGPAEATVAVTAHLVEKSAETKRHAAPIVALGRPFEDVQADIFDDQKQRVCGAGRGELWLGGPQLIDGYLGDDDANARHFVKAQGQTWFRTGDLVERDAAGCLHFLGRLDERLKIRGHHVDLATVDAALRRACGHPEAAVVPYPTGPGQVGGLVAVVAFDEPVDTTPILAHCRRHLPPPMVPDQIVVVENLPRNGHDKFDRRAMQQLLNSREG